MFQRQIPV